MRTLIYVFLKLAYLLFILFIGYKGYSFIFYANELDNVDKFYLKNIVSGSLLLFIAVFQIYMLTLWEWAKGYDEAQKYLLNREKY